MNDWRIWLRTDSLTITQTMMEKPYWSTLTMTLFWLESSSILSMMGWMSLESQKLESKLISRSKGLELFLTKTRFLMMRSQESCISIQMKVRRKTRLMSMVNCWQQTLLCKMGIEFCLETIICMLFSFQAKNYLQVLWIMKQLWKKQLMIS